MKGENMNTPATKCWSCGNACGGCSWSDGTFTPVNGWTAEETSIVGDRGEFRAKRIQSYRVIECPEYKDDDNRMLLSQLRPQIASTTLHKYIRRGELKAEFIDHKWWVRHEDWIEFLRTHRRAT